MLALDIDCLEHPEILETPENACRTAAWFWKTRGLSALADKEAFELITRKINGGLNGLEDRKALYAVAKSVLGIK